MACDPEPSAILVLKGTGASYNRKRGHFTLKRTYYFEGVDPEDVIGTEYGTLAAGRVPGNVAISDPNGDTVTCYAIDREAVRPETSGESETWLTVTYEGLSLGAMHYEIDVQSMGEQTVVSMADVDGVHHSIGANNEGTNVDRPYMIMIILENVRMVDFMPAKMNLISALSGSVNEPNWKPDILVGLGAGGFDMGQWLYQGVDHTYYPGGYFTLVHSFMMVPIIGKPIVPGSRTTEEMQLYKWYPYVSRTDDSREIPTGSADFPDREIRAYGEEVESQIHQIAGVDIAEKFGDLNL